MGSALGIAPSYLGPAPPFQAAGPRARRGAAGPAASAPKRLCSTGAGPGRLITRGRSATPRGPPSASWPLAAGGGAAKARAALALVALTRAPHRPRRDAQVQRAAVAAVAMPPLRARMSRRSRLRLAIANGENQLPLRRQVLVFVVFVWVAIPIFVFALAWMFGGIMARCELWPAKARPLSCGAPPCPSTALRTLGALPRAHRTAGGGKSSVRTIGVTSDRPGRCERAPPRVVPGSFSLHGPRSCAR